jgi:CHAD domain-containing protein
MDESKGAAVALPSEAAQARVGPKQLVHEHVPRFLKLLPEVLSGERAEAVHDLRVWSRRRQQVLVTIFPGTQGNRADSVIRAVRRTRRGLSGWRDCDVLIAHVKFTGSASPMNRERGRRFMLTSPRSARRKSGERGANLQSANSLGWGKDRKIC